MTRAPDPAAGPPRETGRHGLGPHVVGQRVVVRRLVRGETGPTGGPAMTDVIGVCEAWPEQRGGLVLVRREDGTLVQISTSDIVSGKPVPPRPSRFSRLSAEEVERHAAGIFRPAEVRRAGGWLLRWSGGSNRRPNSILAVGDPGLPLEEVLAEAESFYAAHGMQPTAQVVVDSPAQEELASRGWVRLDATESDTDVLLAGVAALSRRLRGIARPAVEEVGPEAGQPAGERPPEGRAVPPAAGLATARPETGVGASSHSGPRDPDGQSAPDGPVSAERASEPTEPGERVADDAATGLTIRHADAISRDWLVGNDRALANYQAVERTLRLDDAVFVSVHDPDGAQVARGRVNLVDDWALFADLTVQPRRRRDGLAHVVMAEVTRWAAERGATTMLLEAQADNTAAQALYRSLGFERHHAYRYLVPPGS